MRALSICLPLVALTLIGCGPQTEPADGTIESELASAVVRPQGTFRIGEIDNSYYYEWLTLHDGSYESQTILEQGFGTYTWQKSGDNRYIELTAEAYKPYQVTRYEYLYAGGDRLRLRETGTLPGFWDTMYQAGDLDYECSNAEHAFCNQGLICNIPEGEQVGQCVAPPPAQ